jgi:hypothetical protein
LEDGETSCFSTTIFCRIGRSLKIKWNLWRRKPEGNLTNASVYFFTDNSTVEFCLYEGNSSSLKLFRLMVWMRKLEMTRNAKIVLSHVSRKRMIKEGTDGVSRGQLREGVTTGELMLLFIPLNEDQLDRTPKLNAWGSNPGQETQQIFWFQTIGSRGDTTIGAVH